MLFLLTISAKLLPIMILNMVEELDYGVQSLAP